MADRECSRLTRKESAECKIGYSYSPGRVTWSAQLGPVLNEDSPDALREAIKRGYAEVLEKIGEWTRGASPAAIGSRRRGRRTWPTIRFRSPGLRLLS